MYAQQDSCKVLKENYYKVCLWQTDILIQIPNSLASVDSDQWEHHKYYQTDPHRLITVQNSKHLLLLEEELNCCMLTQPFCPAERKKIISLYYQLLIRLQLSVIASFKLQGATVTRVNVTDKSTTTEKSVFFKFICFIGNWVAQFWLGGNKLRPKQLGEGTKRVFPYCLTFIYLVFTTTPEQVSVR